MRIILSLLLFISFSFANYIKSIEVLKDDPSISFENVKENKNFKTAKQPIIIIDKNNYWVKIKIDKKKIDSKKNYILEISSTFALNTFEFDKALKENFLDNKKISFNKKDIQDIFFKVTNGVNVGRVDVSIKIDERKNYFKDFKDTQVFFGISYGVIFAAFLYYLAFFIFNRQKSFIYYSLTQISILTIVMLLTENPNPDSMDTLIYAFAIISFHIFSNLFTQEFLNTKQNSPISHKILIILMILMIIELFAKIIVQYFPPSVFLSFYIIAAIVVYLKTKAKPILFYIVAWSLFIGLYITIDFQYYFIDYFAIYIDQQLLIHLIVPLESLILAFALSYKMKKLLEESKIDQERLLIHQNKLASMGEMISNIAHQWRQPLSHVSYIIMNINSAFKYKKLDELYLKEKTKEASQQLKYMSNTIDDFKDFYSPKNKKEIFYVEESIKNALTIIFSVLKENHIRIEKQGEDFKIDGYKSELSQIILNIITNAKDSLIENNIKKPKINIIYKKNKIEIYDNAGGIKENIRNKIFEPYFTTKEKGTGIGLYMSKMIIQTHFKGSLSHKNTSEGSCFSIYLK